MKNDYDFGQARRGPVIATPGKTRITIRLDADVLDWFRAQASGGGSYQSLINAALREHIHGNDPGPAATLRRIVREELKDGG